MRRLIGLSLVVVVGLAMLAFGVPSAQAQSTFYRITGGPPGGNYCTSGYSVNVPTFRQFTVAGSVRGIVTVDGVGVVQDDTLPSFGPISPAASGSWGIFPGAYSVPGGTIIRLEITTYSQTGLVGPVWVTRLAFNCSTGAVTELVDYPYGVSTASTAVFAGPPIPSGYELRTITCDVAVFDAPGGKPIGDNRIKAGQTFYVNPKGEKAADGELWSKVFVSGYTDPWIPTRCIGG